MQQTLAFLIRRLPWAIVLAVLGVLAASFGLAHSAPAVIIIGDALAVIAGLWLLGLFAASLIAPRDLLVRATRQAFRA